MKLCGFASESIKATNSLATLLRILQSTQDELVDFAEEAGFLPRAEQLSCVECGSQLRRIRHNDSQDGWTYYCGAIKQRSKRRRGKRCSYKRSLRLGTLFEKSHLTLQQILAFIYLWVNNLSATKISLFLGLSRRSIHEWTQLCYEVVESYPMEPIGGPGIIVEIDETHCGRRKYNRGRRTGLWVFGGVERGTKGRSFMTAVPNRSAETLIRLIKVYIRPGTIIMSDLWKAYGRIPHLPEGYAHFTVNHKKNFVDPRTGAHTQNIERLWRSLKHSLPIKRDEHYFPKYLAKFLFLRHAGEGAFHDFGAQARKFRESLISVE